MQEKEPIETHFIYTLLQKKPISLFSGQLWKLELRNENILYHIP